MVCLFSHGLQKGYLLLTFNDGSVAVQGKCQGLLFSDYVSIPPRRTYLYHSLCVVVSRCHSGPTAAARHPTVA